MPQIEIIMKNLEELVELLHQAKDLGGYVDADRLWFRLNEYFTELKDEIPKLFKSGFGDIEEARILINEHIEHYGKELSESAKRLMLSAIMHQIRNLRVYYHNEHSCSCQIEGVDEDFHCEYYIGCKKRDILNCLKCPIYFEYLNRPEKLPEWIVDGVCKKYKTHPTAICNLGYACDGCPYFPNGDKEVE